MGARVKDVVSCVFNFDGIFVNVTKLSFQTLDLTLLDVHHIVNIPIDVEVFVGCSDVVSIAFDCSVPTFLKCSSGGQLDRSVG